MESETKDVFLVESWAAGNNLGARKTREIPREMRLDKREYFEITRGQGNQEEPLSRRKSSL